MTLGVLAFAAGILSGTSMAQANELSYNEDNWNAFIKPYLDGKSARQETLCKTKKGRDVEMLRFGKGSRKLRILVTARHNADDVIGNYVIEGFIQGMLSEELRNWSLHHTDIVVIPFVDKDGVVENTPGADYSQRYGEDGIPATQAIKEFLKGKWERWYPSVIVDLHAKDARNTAKGASFVGRPYDAIDVDTDWHWQQTGRFSKTLAGFVGGELRHDPADNVPWNQGWNRDQKPDEVSLISWASSMTSLRFATRLEVPPASSAEAAREFGRSLARALRKDIEGREDAVSGYYSERARMRSRIILPDSYERNPDKSFPVIVDLRGTMQFGAPRYALDTPDFPCVVVAPGMPGVPRWEYCTEALSFLIDEICEKYRVDKERIYLTGLSIGGYGTWEMAMQHPEKFAAIAPVSGFGCVKGLENITELPVWAIQGEVDKSVRLVDHKRTADALEELGGDVKFTVVEGLGHDAFRYAYHQPGLYEWLLQHTSPGVAPVEPDYKDIEIVSLKSLVVPESEGKDPKEAANAIRQFCADSKLGSESGIRYFAANVYPHKGQCFMNTGQISAPEGIKFKQIPDMQYLTLPYPESIKHGVDYYRHTGKFFRWMTANNLPLTRADKLLFEYSDASRRTRAIQSFIPITEKEQ